MNRNLPKLPLTRRNLLATLLLAVPVLNLVVRQTQDPAQPRKIQWQKLEDEPLDVCDFWASEDPNAPEQQGAPNERQLHPYNLQLHAIHKTEIGTPANKTSIGYGAYWRPIGLVPVCEASSTV